MQITEILKKPEEERTVEEQRLLELSPDVAKEILKRSKTRELAKERKLEVRENKKVCGSKPKCEKQQTRCIFFTRKCHIFIFLSAAKSSLFQVEDERNVVVQKSVALADAIKKSKCLVIYTGAGISTVSRPTDLVCVSVCVAKA